MSCPSDAMKRLISVAIGLLLATGLVWAEFYRLDNVKRVDRNLYRAGRLIIETRYCLYRTMGEEAVLKWEGRYGDNHIFWSDGTSCEVKTVASI